jgi:hypothetical protein
MPIHKKAVTLDVGLDEEGERAFIVYTDPKAQWIADHGGQQPPQGMVFDPKPLVYTRDPEYAFWNLHLGDLQKSLAEIVGAVQSVGNNPVAAIPLVTTKVQEIMDFVQSSTAGAAKIEMDFMPLVLRLKAERAAQLARHGQDKK